MVTERTATAALERLDALPGSGADADDVQASIIEIVRRVVPFDAACWATVDPETRVFTGSMTIEFEPTAEMERRFVAIEAAGTDVHSFNDLSARSRAVARLSDAGPHAVEASDRLQDIWAPIGIGHELRAAFSVADRCWAVAGMLRATDGADFSDDEVDFLVAASPRVAVAMRSAVLRASRADRRPVEGPAVVIVDGAGATTSLTPAAAALFAHSARLASPTGRTALASLVGAIRHGAPSARARIHDEEHGWIVLDASPLTGLDRSGEVVVTITPAASADVASLLLTAHGLSPREQDVVGAVLAGLSTAGIAERLFISPNTVQDHLKAVFQKVGVRSRRELVAALSGQGPAAP